MYTPLYYVAVLYLIVYNFTAALHNDNGSAAMAGTIGGGLKGAQKQIQAGELSLPTVSKGRVIYRISLHI